MSKQTPSSFFIVPSGYGLYQQLLKGIGAYEDIWQKVVNQTNLCHSFRQKDNVRELSLVLTSAPIKEYRLIGQYYSVWADRSEKKEQPYILEQVIEHSLTYKAKALQSRAAYEIYQGNLREALYFYMECFRTPLTVSEYAETAKAIAYIKSVEGFHESALKDLENLIPILRHAEPFAYYDIMNSYAMELGEAGRKDEARNIIEHVVASPFAQAYPEWQETAQDLRRPNSSFVAFDSTLNNARNVLFMPRVEHVKSEQPTDNRPARVLNLQQWKKQMAKDTNSDAGAKKSLAVMSEKEIFLRALELFSNTKIPGKKRRKMLEAIENVLAEPIPSKPEPDDSDGA